MWISLIQNLGIKRYQKLIQKFSSIENIWKSSKKELLEVPGINERIINLIVNNQIKQDINRHLEYMDKNSINIVFIEDDNYPKLLKTIYNPPLCLYIRGSIEILNNPAISVVGCRDASNYGKKCSREFSYNISKYGYVIVSGLAKGIDSYAHIGAIDSKGKTIAVLGNGLDTIYPKENMELANKILYSGGSIISEYPLGTKPYKSNFPLRNRIISGLSKGLLVIESKEKSGTTITIDWALEQGRDVFAVPGNIDSITSFGTNNIIKQGAKLVTTWEEVVEEYL